MTKKMATSGFIAIKRGKKRTKYALGRAIKWGNNMGSGVPIPKKRKSTHKKRKNVKTRKVKKASKGSSKRKGQKVKVLGSKPKPKRKSAGGGRVKY